MKGFHLQTIVFRVFCIGTTVLMLWDGMTYLYRGMNKMISLKKPVFWLGICVFCLLMTLQADAAWTPPGQVSSASYVAGSSDDVIILAGDSRTMYLSVYAVSDMIRNFVLCWVNGGSVSIIKKNGSLVSTLESALERYPNAPVVMNLGYNGNSYPKSNARKLIREYSRWEKKYPSHRFFIANVGPAASSGQYSDENVCRLNKALAKEYGGSGRYIDLYGYLTKKKAALPDGTGLLPDGKHYGSTAGREMLSCIRNYVNRHADDDMQ